MDSKLALSPEWETSSPAPPPFRGPAADSALGERLIDVIGIVAATGFAAEVSHCLYLCGETYRKGDKGATNDMLVRSLERQCGARAARAAALENMELGGGNVVGDTTQLIRATRADDLPRVLQLVQLGAPLDHADERGFTALRWACALGLERVARALLVGKYEGRRGAVMDTHDNKGWTPLMWASAEGHEDLVRLLLARGARLRLQNFGGCTALHMAVVYEHPGTVALLCAAPGGAAALAVRDYNGETPLGSAVSGNKAACEAVLRANGAVA
jgi:hypothetical protein